MKVYLAGIMVPYVMSNKPDGKERNLEDERNRRSNKGGRFENERQSKAVRHKNLIHHLMVIFLLTWDGLLLYMIVEYLIEPVYGAAFVAVVSVYLGKQL